MSGKNIPPCPASLKQIQHYLKAATEHDDRDIIISYWCRLYALQVGLKIDRSSPDAKRLFSYLMDWLEKTKAEQGDNEAIANELPAQAHLENYAFRLFVWADSQDRTGTFNKNVVKAFYTAGLIYDVLDTFGEVSEDVAQNRKYAKWKAAYIHNCIKNGEVPVPGPICPEGENMNEPSSSTLPPFNYRARGFSGNGIAEAPSAFPLSTGSTLRVSVPETIQEIDSQSPNIGVGKSLGTGVGPSTAGIHLPPEKMAKAQKYCKWAASALSYDDVPTAIVNLQKAIHLLTTGLDE